MPIPCDSGFFLIRPKPGFRFTDFIFLRVHDLITEAAVTAACFHGNKTFGDLLNLQTCLNSIIQCVAKQGTQIDVIEGQGLWQVNLQIAADSMIPGILFLCVQHSINDAVRTEIFSGCDKLLIQISQVLAGFIIVFILK